MGPPLECLLWGLVSSSISNFWFYIFFGVGCASSRFAIIPTIGTWKAFMIRHLKSRPFVTWNYILCKKNPLFGLFNTTWLLESMVFEQYWIGWKGEHFDNLLTKMSHLTIYSCPWSVLFFVKFCPLSINKKIEIFVVS